jgi:hypothetical protein
VGSDFIKKGFKMLLDLIWNKRAFWRFVLHYQGLIMVIRQE